MNTRWLIKNWFRVGAKISWKLSFETLISLLYFIPIFQNDSVYKMVQRKHSFVLSYLKEHYSYLIDQFKCYSDSESISKQISTKKYIWVMWWQGEENAPDLVKMCIRSIRKNSNGAEVVVITQDNFKDYVEIPEYILNKHEKGIVSFAQLSDIMRVFLISKYGGLWLDSTIYVSQPIPSTLFEKPFFSLHTALKKTPFVQNDRIHCFVLGGMADSRIFEFERMFLSDYWREHDVIIDYYLLDYSLMLQYFMLPNVQRIIDGLEFTSDGLYDLVSILDKPYDATNLERILENNVFSKLVWNKKHRTKKVISNFDYLYTIS